MAIKAGKVVINDVVADKKTLMNERNISIAEKVSRKNAATFPTKSKQVTVIENGIEKVVYKNSKYLEDLTTKGE
jgi:hypothetical protein